MVMRASFASLFMAAVLSPVLLSASAEAQALRSPFDVAAAREARGQPAGYFACPSAPKGTKDVEFGGYYADRGSGSTRRRKRPTARRLPTSTNSRPISR
jgi:hypothetical protein